MSEIIQQDTSIEQQANAAIAAFANGSPLLVNEKFNLQDLEKFQTLRRSYQVRFGTKSIAAWCSYCKTEISGIAADQPAIAFVDGDKSSAIAVFDLGTPEAPKHGRWTARITVEKTPEYLAFLNALNERTSQRDLCEWVEEWSGSLSFLNSEGDKIPTKKAFNALRTITIKAKKNSESRVEDHSASRSTMESVEAESRENALPSFVVMTTPPHMEFKPRDFIARISLLTGEDNPRFVLRPQRLEKIREDIAKEFVEKIQEGTKGSGLRVEIGTAEY